MSEVTTLYSVSNGFHGYGKTAVLVMAESEDDAIARAVPVFAANNNAMEHERHEYADPTHMRAKRVELPYFGDELP